jgi:hypothetical protein
MANLSDRLKQFEQTTKSEQEATERMLQDAFDELKSKLTGLQGGAMISIETSTQKFLVDVDASLKKSRETLKDAAMRNAIEAQSWSQRGMLLWAKSGGVLIAWLVVLIVMSAWSAYLWSETPKLQDRYNELKHAYQKESLQLDMLLKHHMAMIEDPAGSLWVQVDPKNKPQRREDGTLWLLAEGKARQ